MKFALLVLLLLFGSAIAQAQGGRVIHVSPDGRLRAVVTPTWTDKRGTYEHRVEIRTARGRRIALSDYSSVDHDHGLGVITATWTPDSRFFVFSTTSSGGHRPWQFPTYAYVRSRSAIILLDDVLRPFMTPSFSLLPPSRFVSEGLNDEGSDHPNVAVDVKLADLRWPKSR